MKRKELYERVQTTFGVRSKAASKEIVECFVSVLVDALSRGESVTLPGFGKFEISHRKAKTAAHPRTGAPIDVPGYSTAAFRLSGIFKKILRKKFN